MTTGRIESIWIKRAHGGPIDATDRAALVAGQGLAGNASVGGKRQVTIISLERWQEVERTVGQTVDPAARRANVLVSGVALEESRGKILRLGASRILVRGETRPCEQMDAACAGLTEALSAPWAGGAFGEILEGGEIAVGDPVSWDGSAAMEATEP